MQADLSQLEAEIASALAAADHERAVVLTLKAYGSEILGFLMAQLRSDQHAEEVFSTFAEDLWRSLPNLTLRTGMRAYVYALARNAKSRFLDRDLRKQRRAVPLSQVEEVSRIVAEARSGTATHQATDAKNRLTMLRDRLSADEQALLTLRIDRKLEWLEIAEAMGEGEGDLKLASARYRKRFQALKDKLARWAREEGLLKGNDDAD